MEAKGAAMAEVARPRMMASERMRVRIVFPHLEKRIGLRIFRWLQWFIGKMDSPVIITGDPDDTENLAFRLHNQ